MGAQQAKSEVSSKQRFVDSMVQKCGATSCENYSGPIVVHVAGDGTVSDLRITQQCDVDTECLYNAMSESIAQLKAKAAAEAAAGLGIAASEVDVETSQEILKKQEQDCGVTEADNIIESIEIGVGDQGKLENMSIEQIGNAKQKCMFQGLSSTYAESEAAGEAKATGFDPLGIGLIIAALAVVAFLAYNQWSALTYQKGPGPFAASWGIVILILVAIGGGAYFFSQ